MKYRPFLAVALVVASAVVGSCGRRETAAERVSRLRLQYDVEPDGFQPRWASDGTPELVLSVRVVNRGRESLDTLTVLVRVVAPTGEERVVRRLTLDTRGLRPGVSEQLSGVLPGVEFQEGDTVFLEREVDPPAAHRHLYPEYGDGG